MRCMLLKSTDILQNKDIEKLFSSSYIFILNRFLVVFLKIKYAIIDVIEHVIPKLTQALLYALVTKIYVSYARNRNGNLDTKCSSQIAQDLLIR